jgi:hypothetical protein
LLRAVWYVAARRSIPGNGFRKLKRWPVDPDSGGVVIIGAIVRHGATLAGGEGRGAGLSFQWTGANRPPHWKLWRIKRMIWHEPFAADGANGLRSRSTAGEQEMTMAGDIANI